MLGPLPYQPRGCTIPHIKSSIDEGGGQPSRLRRITQLVVSWTNRIPKQTQRPRSFASGKLNSTWGGMALGRQCLQCRKRRAKCDSEDPQCRKCAIDNLICPGYSKPLRWIQVQPRNEKNKRCDTEHGNSALARPTAPSLSDASKASSRDHRLVQLIATPTPSCSI